MQTTDTKHLTVQARSGSKEALLVPLQSEITWNATDCSMIRDSVRLAALQVQLQEWQQYQGPHQHQRSRKLTLFVRRNLWEN